MKSFQFFWNKQRDREARIAVDCIPFTWKKTSEEAKRRLLAKVITHTFFQIRKVRPHVTRWFIKVFFFPVCFQCLYLFPLHHSCPLFVISILIKQGLPWWLSGKESSCQCRWCRFDPWFGKIPWQRKWQPTPVFFPGKSNRQKVLGYSPWGCKELDTI